MWWIPLAVAGAQALANSGKKDDPKASSAPSADINIDTGPVGGGTPTLGPSSSQERPTTWQPTPPPAPIPVTTPAPVQLGSAGPSTWQPQPEPMPTPGAPPPTPLPVTPPAPQPLPTPTFGAPNPMGGMRFR